MQTINCYIPLKLRLRGETSEDDWANLEEVLVARYTRTLRRSIAKLTRSQFIEPGMLETMAEPFAPERVRDDGYVITSYDRGELTEVPLLTRRANTVDPLYSLLQRFQWRKDLQAILDADVRFKQGKKSAGATPLSSAEVEDTSSRIAVLDKEIDALLHTANIPSLADAKGLLMRLFADFSLNKYVLDLVRRINILPSLLEKLLPLTDQRTKLESELDRNARLRASVPEGKENELSGGTLLSIEQIDILQRQIYKLDAEIDKLLGKLDLRSTDDIDSLRTEFLSSFATVAREIALYILDQSELAARVEEARYTTHTSEKKVVEDIEGLRKRAEELAKLEHDISHAVNNLTFFLVGTNKEGHILTEREQDKIIEYDREIERRKRIFEDTKYSPDYGQRYPILLTKGIDYEVLASSSDKGLSREAQEHIQDQIKDIVEKIQKSRNNLEDKDLIWSLPPIVQFTKLVMDIKPASYADQLIENEVAARKPSTIARLLLAVIGLALGIIAIFVTGGTAIIVLAASATINISTAIEETREYLIFHPASGTALDPKAAISQEDRSLAALAISILGAVVDVGVAGLAFKDMVQAIKTAKTLEEVEKAARLEAEALAKSGKLKPGVSAEQLTEQIMKDVRAAEAGKGKGSVRSPEGPSRRTKPKGQGSKRAAAEHLAEESAKKTTQVPRLTKAEQRVKEALIRDYKRESIDLANDDFFTTKAAEGGVDFEGKGGVKGGGGDVLLKGGGRREVKVRIETSQFDAESIGSTLIKGEAQKDVKEIYALIKSAGATQEGLLKMEGTLLGYAPNLENVYVRLFGPDGTVWWQHHF